MSGKTKAELEAEITELSWQNDALRDDLAYLKRHIEKLRINFDFDQVRKQSDVCSIAQFSDQIFENLLKIEPEIRKEERSKGGKHAINARWEIPGWKEEDIKKEYKRLQRELGPDTKSTTIYKEMSMLIFKRKTSWRRFKRLIEK